MRQTEYVYFIIVRGNDGGGGDDGWGDGDDGGSQSKIALLIVTFLDMCLQ